VKKEKKTRRCPPLRPSEKEEGVGPFHLKRKTGGKEKKKEGEGSAASLRPTLSVEVRKGRRGPGVVPRNKKGSAPPARPQKGGKLGECGVEKARGKKKKGLAAARDRPGKKYPRPAGKRDGGEEEKASPHWPEREPYWKKKKKRGRRLESWEKGKGKSSVTFLP